MTVQELQQKLENLPAGAEIRLFSDPEGNRIWGLYSAETGLEASELQDKVVLIPCYT